jgi:DNA-binding NarL/FixJ family response regulator
LTTHRGGVGYLLKDRIVSTDDFLDALRRVADGGTALDPEVVRQLLATPATDSGIARLSARERESSGCWRRAAPTRPSPSCYT